MWITLDENHAQTLTRQLYEKVRSAILTGRLAASEKLPSTRRLAAELGIARNTVIEVYSQLIAEGYLEAAHGSATRVVRDLPPVAFRLFPLPEETDNKTNHRPDYKPDHNPGKSRDVAGQNTDEMPSYIDFRTGVPALSHFPRNEWSRQYRAACLDLPAEGYGYCHPFGVWELRAALCRYLLRVRGIVCEPDQIMITTGATQGLSLLTRFLSRDRQEVLIEDPSHPGLRKVITMAGGILKTADIDEKGMLTCRLDEKDHPAFVYTTPSHQYPLGGIMPVQRRLELIRYAWHRDCYIVEDDYDSEFRYGGAPVSTMYELDPGKVIYIGSFSKTLSPALRLGYMIMPFGLTETLKREKAYSDVHTDALNQYTMAGFLDSGAFEKHIWKMKKYYIRQRKCLLKGLEHYFPGRHEVLGDASGLHLAVRFDDIVFTEKTVRRMAQAGVKIYPVSRLYLHHREPDHLLVMGYSHLSSEEIWKGLEIIKTEAGASVSE